MKKCNKCELVLDFDNFAKCNRNKDKLDTICKLCRNKHNKLYRLNNQDKVKKARKKHYDNNIIKIREEKKRYCAKNKDKKAIYDIEYRKKNKEKIQQHKKNWSLKNKDNILHKIKRNLRRRIHHVIKDGYKSLHSIELLGCDIQFFKTYLESKFYANMTWENYGSYWHIDHIIPCSHFNLILLEEQKKCFHYTNCQPLLKIDNLRKGDRYPFI